MKEDGYRSGTIRVEGTVPQRSSILDIGHTHLRSCTIHDNFKDLLSVPTKFLSPHSKIDQRRLISVVRSTVHEYFYLSLVKFG